jgi:hypothetical protein
MSKNRAQIDKVMKKAKSDLHDLADAVFICVVTTPTHDDAIGDIHYTRAGTGPAYTMMMYALSAEMAQQEDEVEVSEIDEAEEEGEE